MFKQTKFIKASPIFFGKQTSSAFKPAKTPLFFEKVAQRPHLFNTNATQAAALATTGRFFSLFPQHGKTSTSSKSTLTSAHQNKLTPLQQQHLVNKIVATTRALLEQIKNRQYNQHNNHKEQRRNFYNHYNSDEYDDRYAFLRNPVYIIIAANIIIFVFYQFAPLSLKRFMKENFFISLQNYHLVHTFVTSAFMHADWMHLLINCFVLYQFGNTVFQMVGTRKFLWMYMLSAIVANMAYLAERYYYTKTARNKQQYISNQVRSACGASGAISALLAFWCMCFPYAEITLYFVFPIPARFLLIGTGLLEVGRMIYSQDRTSIAASAHLGGLVSGLGFYRVFMKM